MLCLLQKYLVVVYRCDRPTGPKDQNVLYKTSRKPNFMPIGRPFGRNIQTKDEISNNWSVLYTECKQNIKCFLVITQLFITCSYKIFLNRYKSDVIFSNI
jgi:hypothetical protein